MTERMDAAALRQGLTQFHGTAEWHRHWLGQLLLTDGALYFANQAGAHWLVDIVATELMDLQRREGLLFLTLHCQSGAADLVADDGNGNALYQKHIDLTDCPEGKWRFILTDDVLMLPGEY